VSAAAAARLTLCAALVLTAVGCAPRRAPEPAVGTVLFDGSVRELVPLHDGDWFLYNAGGGGHEPHPELSKISALPKPDSLLVTFSQKDLVLGRVHLRYTNDALEAVSEIDSVGGIGVLYATPVPLFLVPVREGTRRASSAVQIWRLSDRSLLGRGQVDFEFTNTRAPNGEIETHVERTLKLPDQTTHTEHTIWLRPGVGEIRSGSGGDNGLRRTLACAQIDGKSYGTCP
jgi:hypothetical protein